MIGGLGWGDLGKTKNKKGVERLHALVFLMFDLGMNDDLGAYLKFAWMVMSLFMVTVIDFAVPETLPDHPIQGEPASGTAVRVREVPGVKLVPATL